MLSAQMTSLAALCMLILAGPATAPRKVAFRDL